MKAITLRTPWLSLLLLLVAYSSFGWSLCYHAFPLVDSLPPGLPAQAALDQVLLKPALPKVVLLITVGGALMLSLAFMRPVSSFTRFINRWFKSDTVAFLCIAMFAGSTAVILYWLQIFLFVLTIAASGALARIDLQTCCFSESQSFYILSTVSLVGLISGWMLRVLI